MRWCEIRKPRSLTPFSHYAGVHVSLPTTTYTVAAYPTRLQIFDETGLSVKEHLFKVSGPIEDFTVLSNLERGAVTVTSRYYRFHVLPNLEVIETRRPPLSDLPKEELFLGSLKQPKWEALAERCDPKEILPLWHRLGTLLSLPDQVLESVGLFSLIEKARALKEQKEHAQLLEPLMQLYRAGFSATLVPRSSDTQYQGIVEDMRPLPFSCHYLLTEGARLIRSFFYQEKEGSPCFLPHLPSECFSGSFYSLETKWGTFHFRWTKKQLREVWLESKYNGTLAIGFPKALKRCRLRTNARDRGVSALTSDSFEINSKHDYVWDRFEK
jgi:hypothetical protein